MKRKLPNKTALKKWSQKKLAERWNDAVRQMDALEDLLERIEDVIQAKAGKKAKAAFK